MLREAGVDIWKINWVIAPVEGPAAAPRTDVPPLDVPSNVTAGPQGSRWSTCSWPTRSTCW